MHSPEGEQIRETPHRGNRIMSRRACAFAALALTACVWTACARAQGFDLRALFGLPPGNSASLANAPVPPDAGEWSGESGASGDPLMTASALRAGAANFHQCLTGVWRLAERRGVPRALFEPYLAGSPPSCTSWILWIRSRSSRRQSGITSIFWRAVNA